MRAATIALALVAVASCGPPTTGARRLWVDSPVDGVLTLLDHEPPPY